MSKQKRKGDGYERELAKWLDWMLFAGKGQVQRMPLSGGGSHVGGGGRADLNGTPSIWVEAKRTERFTPYAAMEQAEAGIKNAMTDEMPAVITRRNRMATEDSMVVMRLKDWVILYASFLKECGHDVWEPEFDIISFDPDEELKKIIKQPDKPTRDDIGEKVVRLFPKNGDHDDGEETD